MRARLMWDVNADPDVLLADFYKHFFGSAAAPMQQFCESIETMLQSSPDNIAYVPFLLDWSATYPSDKIAALGPLLNQAEKLADSPEVKRRLALYRILHNYMTSYSRVHTLQHEGKYSEALALLETLPKTIADAQAIQPGLLPPDVKWILDDGLGFVHLKKHLTLLADRVDGKKGELLGRAPAQAQFLTDPKNVGLFEQWQREDVASRLKWRPTDLRRHWGLNGYRDGQGDAYDGIGWYRIILRVKKPTQGRAQLAVPLIFAEKIWVWVNGHLVASPTNMTADAKTGPTPGNVVRVNDRGYVSLAVDVHDKLRANAENSVTFRLQGTLERAQHRGIGEVPFIWAPRS